MSPLLLAVPVFTLDLSSNDGGLVEGGDTLQWAWGTPAVGPVGEGRAWGTVLDGPYLHDSADWLELPAVDLSGLVKPTLEVRHWYAIAPGDGGVLEIDDGGGFRRRAPVGGYPAGTGFAGASGGYVDSLWDLSSVSSGARIRLMFRADLAVADDGWFVQRIRLLDGDAVPPTLVQRIVPGDTQDLVGPYVLELDATDDVGVASVTTFWSVDGGPEVPVAAVPAGGATWRATFPGQPPDTALAVRAEAEDAEENLARWPAQGTQAFRVFLAAPTALAADLPARPVVQEIPLSWEAPVSPHSVEAYEVLQDGATVAEVTVEEARIVPDPDLAQVFEVRARYDLGGTPTLGDPSEALALEVDVPRIDLVDPDVVWQGGSSRVTVSGANLYLQQGAVEADLGDGVEVVEVEVQDAHEAVLHVEVDPEAALGPRTLSLEAPLGTFVFEDLLEVGDDLDAPRIRRVDPAAVGQGERVRIELEATVPFGDGREPVEVTVTPNDPDLVVLTDPEVDGAVVRFELAASTRARLGLHTLVVDDLRRQLTADVLVEEVVVQLDTGCRCDSGGTAVAPVPLLVLLVRRRRRW